MWHAAAAQRVDRVGKDVKPLFHHQPAEEGDDRRIVADAKVAPPPHVASAGMENLALDPAGPDADVILHPLLTQPLRKAFGRDRKSVVLVKSVSYLVHPGE